MKSINVFIIDDDNLFVFLTKKIINTTNLETEIKEFGDGKYAIDYLKETIKSHELLPDIILLDLNMPIMDGWGFLEEYKTIEPEISKEIKLYIFSSSISPHDFDRAKGISQVKDYVIKPLFKEKFIEMVYN